MSSDGEGKRRNNLETLEKLKNEIDRAIMQMGDSSSDSEDEGSASTKLKEEKLRQELIKRVEQKFQSAKEEFNESIKNQIKVFNQSIDESIKALKSVCDSPGKHWTKMIQEERPKVFSEKVHIRRISTLTERFKLEDFKTLYYITFAVMFWLAINLLVQRYQSNDHLLDIELLFWVFGHSTETFQLWAAEWIFHALILVEVSWIAKHSPPKWLYLPVYALHQLILITVPTTLTLKLELPPASSMIVCCEMARMSMKMHAYFREKLLYGMGDNQYRKFIPNFAVKKGVVESDLNVPEITVGSLSQEFHKFLYFSFAPTLIYRDHYPRLPRPTRWNNVFVHLFNLLAVIFGSFLLWEIYCIPMFKMTAQQPGSAIAFVNSVFQSMLPGCVILMFGFFGFLHSWFNAWAEILRFADRQFYTDWWNACSFRDYYRTWNIVVHEWLYYYVYQDLIRFSFGKFGRGIAILVVFILSAVIHEVIVTALLGFFYPALFIIFAGPGVIFYYYAKFKKSAGASILFWALMIVGLGLLLVLEARGYYAYHYSDKVNYVTDIDRAVSFLSNLSDCGLFNQTVY